MVYNYGMNRFITAALAGALTLAASSVALGQSAPSTPIPIPIATLVPVPPPTPVPVATNPSVPTVPSSLPLTGPLAPPMP
jgi:hypothetical protein